MVLIYIDQAEQQIKKSSLEAISYGAALAKQLGVKIMLSGQGADELFLGYPGFLTPYWKDLYINKKYYDK